MSSEHLRSLGSLIDACPGDDWDEKIGAFAEIMETSPSSVYRWRTIGPPKYALDAAKHRLNNRNN